MLITKQLASVTFSNQIIFINNTGTAYVKKISDVVTLISPLKSSTRPTFVTALNVIDASIKQIAFIINAVTIGSNQLIDLQTSEILLLLDDIKTAIAVNLAASLSRITNSVSDLNLVNENAANGCEAACFKARDAQITALNDAIYLCVRNYTTMHIRFGINNLIDNFYKGYTDRALKSHSLIKDCMTTNKVADTKAINEATNCTIDDLSDCCHDDYGNFTSVMLEAGYVLQARFLENVVLLKECVS